MALPMPVASRMQPRSTKIGTDRRMRLDMPSSMRPIITMVGTELVKVRKVSAPRPKQKAIGTPMARKNATKPTRKMRMLMWPSAGRDGETSHSSAPAPAITTAATEISEGLAARSVSRSASSAIRPMPTGRAATRQLMGMLSAAEVM